MTDDGDETSRHDRPPPSPALTRVPGYQEWSYFCVTGTEIELLISFTFLDRIELPYAAGGPAARVVALARTRDGRWLGGVDDVAPGAVRFTPRRIDFGMGASTLRFRAGAFALDARLLSCPIEAHLRLRPMGLPAVGSSGRRGAAEPLQWVAVPRLEANGEIVLGAERHEIVAAPAYHDHNWGVSGGDGVAWEWGLVLPPSIALPWTIVYSRSSDRARQSLLSQAILVWREDASCRAFRDHEISIEEAGLLRGGARLRIPPDTPVGEALDTPAIALPRELIVRAASGSDRLELRLLLLDFVEVAVPDELSGRGATLVREVRAEAEVRGTIRGQRVAVVAPAILELNQRASGPRPPPQAQRARSPVR